MEKTTVFTCSKCGQTKEHKSDFITGYVTNKENEKICFDCCAIEDKKQMVETGKIILYFTEKEGKHFVINWPSTLSFPCYPKIALGKHNMAGKRYDYWFKGPDGFIWHGYTIGDNTQIAHCKRTKEK